MLSQVMGPLVEIMERMLLSATCPRSTVGGTMSGETAYSIATTSVNFGDVNLEWTANNNRHPRIPQNIYRFL